MPIARTPKLGRIFQKFNRSRDGEKVYHSTFTIRFQGQDYSTHTSDLKAAKKQLLKLIGESALDKRVGSLGAKKIKVSDILELVLNSYKRDGKASIASMRCYVANLSPMLGHRKAIELSGSDLDLYKDARLADGAKPCTINHELKALRRGFNLAIRSGTLKDPLRIDFLQERNVRTGFITPQQYQSLFRAMPDYLRPLVCVAFHTGMRRSELTEMMRDQVDLEQREIALKSGTTKNGEGRVCPVYGDMPAVLKAWIAQTETDYPQCKLLFHRNGRPIGNFRKAWASAINKAGEEFNGLVLHDLRRSAVRMMTRAGVPRTVAMKLSGHASDSIFRRYDICDSSDIRLAGTLLGAYLNAEAESVNVSAA